MSIALPSGLPDVVSHGEVVARHVFSKHHQVSDAKQPGTKWARSQAFLPQFADDTWLFSVSRTLLLPDALAIEQNGLDVGKASGRRLKGTARIGAGSVRSVAVKDATNNALQHLDIVADEMPDGSTPHHAHITGFLPLPEGADVKEFFKEASEELARQAREYSYITRTLPDQDRE